MTVIETPDFSPFDRKTMIESIDAYGRGLRLVFFKLGDRFAHSIAAIASAGSEAETITPLLTSIEGESATNWPISPPLQSLSIEPRIASEVALLVGMAGRNHWSASVEAIEGERRLEFDVACRRSEEVAELGSRYRWMADVQNLVASSCLIDCSIVGHRINILPEMCLAVSKDDELRIQSPEQTSKTTSRWKYSISLPRD